MAEQPAIIQLLRVLPGELAAVAPTLEGINWSELLRDAGRHGMSGLVWHALQTIGAPIPEDAREILQRDGRAIAADTLKVKMLLLRVLDALASEQVTPILLKGYGLSARYYPAPLLRAASDVDLLANPDDYAKAEKALIGLGLERLREESPQENRKDHHDPRFWGHEKWFGSETGLVELHWRPLSGFGTALSVRDAFGRARATELENRPVLYMSPEDEVVYLAAHAAKHLLGRLGWLYDIKLILSAERSLDWDLICRIAKESEMSAPVYFALEAAHRALAAEVSLSTLQSLKPLGWQRALGREIFSAAQLAASPFFNRNYATYVLRILISSNYRRMAIGCVSLADQMGRHIWQHHLPRLIQKTASSLHLRAI